MTNLKPLLAFAVCAIVISYTTISCGQPTTLEDDPTAIQPARTTEELAQQVVELSKLVADLREQVRGLQSQLATLSLSSDSGALENAFGRIPKDRNLLETYGRAAQGKLRIHNYRGVPTEIYVNGTRWSARVNESYIFVPVGKVAILEARDLGVREPVVMPISNWRPQEDGTLELVYRIER